MNDNNAVCVFVIDCVHSCFLPALQLITFYLVECIEYIGRIDSNFCTGKIRHLCFIACSLFRQIRLYDNAGHIIK